MACIIQYLPKKAGNVQSPQYKHQFTSILMSDNTINESLRLERLLGLKLVSEGKWKSFIHFIVKDAGKRVSLTKNGVLLPWLGWSCSVLNLQTRLFMSSLKMLGEWTVPLQESDLTKHGLLLPYLDCSPHPVLYLFTYG